MGDVDIHGTVLFYEWGLGLGSVFGKVYGADMVLVRFVVGLWCEDEWEIVSQIYNLVWPEIKIIVRSPVQGQVQGLWFIVW